LQKARFTTSILLDERAMETACQLRSSYLFSNSPKPFYVTNACGRLSAASRTLRVRAERRGKHSGVLGVELGRGCQQQAGAARRPALEEIFHLGNTKLPYGFPGKRGLKSSASSGQREGSVRGPQSLHSSF